MWKKEDVKPQGIPIMLRGFRSYFEGASCDACQYSSEFQCASRFCARRCVHQPGNSNQRRSDGQRRSVRGRTRGWKTEFGERQLDDRAERNREGGRVCARSHRARKDRR